MYLGAIHIVIDNTSEQITLHTGFHRPLSKMGYSTWNDYIDKLLSGKLLLNYFGEFNSR